MPLAFEEVPANRRARALRGAQDHVDILRRNDPRLIAEDDREAVREVEGLALGQVRLQFGPEVFLSRIGEQVLDDRAACGCFFQGKKRLAGHPAVFLGLLPALGALAQANDDVQPIVAHVERLALALDAIAENSNGFIAEDLLDAFRRIIRALDALLDRGCRCESLSWRGSPM